VSIRFGLDKLGELPYVQEFFRQIQDFINNDPILATGFKFYEITVDKSVVEFTYPHRLTFMPKDVILLNVSDEESVTFHYDNFTNTNLVFTTTGACTFRAFIGTYRGGA
jgi:hypothetical protein